MEIHLWAGLLAKSYYKAKQYKNVRRCLTDGWPPPPLSEGLDPPLPKDNDSSVLAFFETVACEQALHKGESQ